MTEIMPVPRNSHITVLRPPSIAGPFSIYSGCSSAAQSRFCSKCSTWNIVFAELRACEMFHVEHFGVCSPLPWGGFLFGFCIFSGRRWGAGSFVRGGRVTVRRRTRRFGHAALPPCSVSAPRRTTRRKCRGWLGWHRAEGRAKSARAPPCLAGLLIQARETPPG